MVGEVGSWRLGRAAYLRWWMRGFIDCARRIRWRGGPDPRSAGIGANPELRAVIQDGLKSAQSPAGCVVAARTGRNGPCPRTIYQALYVQARGGLRREVASWLRTGRVQRRPQRRLGQRQQWMATPMIAISERPAEVP